MFKRQDLVEQLGNDLDRARDRRDALASDVTTLNAQIAELETRLSEETDRRERDRVAGEIEGIKKRIEDAAIAFAPIIARLCDATETAAAVVPEARELNNFLAAAATEVHNAIGHLVRELNQKAQAVRAGDVEPPLMEPVKMAPEPSKISDRLLLLPWPPKNNAAAQKESAEDRRSTAA